MIYIIGSGLTAQILRYFHPTATIISMGASKDIPLNYLWDTPYTRKFCTQFSIPFEEQTITNNYIGAGDTDENIKQYNKITYKRPDNKPSLGHFNIKILKMKFQPIRAYLPFQVSSIDDKAHRLTTKCNVRLPYKRLYFTGYLNGLTVHYQNETKTFSQTLNDIHVLEYEGMPIFKSDYIYCFDKKYLDHGLYRVSRNGIHHSFELVNCPDFAEARKTIETEFPALQYKGMHTIRKALISSTDTPSDTPTLKFYGRYSTGNYETLQSDVIQKMYNELGVYL